MVVSRAGAVGTDAPEAAPLSPMHAPSERPAQRKDEPVEPGTWTSALFSPVLKFFGNEDGGTLSVRHGMG